MTIENSIGKFISEISETGIKLFPYLANTGQNFNSEKDTVYYSGPYWDTREVEVAINVLLTGSWLTSGENVNRFERAFSKHFNFTNSVMVNSGSSANLVMIAALKEYYGWSDGDEIIVSVVGFPTTVSAILQNNLVPVFVDISWDDLNWDVSSIVGKITPKTKALFSSPVLGNPYDFDWVLEICQKFDLKLIADNCDSLGSKWRGNYLTDYAVASSCSFYPAHHISTMEGGMVSSANSEIIELARSFAWWGRACYCVGKQNLLPNGTCKKRFDNWIPNCSAVVDHKYVFDRVGYNLKPLDLQGAVGLVQLEKFERIHNLRQSNKMEVDRIFSRLPYVRKIEESALADTSWFGAPMICEDGKQKAKLVSHLELNRVQTRNYFAGNLLQQTGYSHLDDWRRYPNASKVLDRVFFVGVSPTITPAMLEYVDEVIQKIEVI
jgi:CDP-6-deoxy-D-xylo-4-hexulose-3-dehydrase